MLLAWGICQNEDPKLAVVVGLPHEGWQNFWLTVQIGISWCAEGKVPTTANQNLDRGWRSCVGWHRDDEQQAVWRVRWSQTQCFSEFCSSAIFKWRRQSCQDDEGHLFWLGQGDILVVDGQWKVEFFHNTDPGREQNPISVTFCWVKQHVFSCFLFDQRCGILFANVFAQGSLVLVVGNFENDVFFFFFFEFLASLVQGLGYIGVPPVGRALWAEVGGGITCVTFGENAWQLIKLPVSILGFRKNHVMGAVYASPSGTTEYPWL